MHKGFYLQTGLFVAGSFTYLNGELTYHLFELIGCITFIMSLLLNEAAGLMLGNIGKYLVHWIDYCNPETPKEYRTSIKKTN